MEKIIKFGDIKSKNKNLTNMKTYFNKKCRYQ